MVPFFVLPQLQFDRVKVDPYVELREWTIRRVNPTFSGPADANRTDLYSRLRLGVGATAPGGIWSGKVEYQRVQDLYCTHPANGSMNYSDASLAYLQYTIPTMTVTGGRQKIEVANQRLIGSTQWLPLSRTFDAARTQSGQWDAWFGRLGVANTKPETARVGAVTHIDKTWGTTSLIYKHDVAPFGDIDIETLDHVISHRWGKTSFDAEAAVQGGSDNGKTQQAWAWHAAGHEDITPCLVFSLQADAASGGSDKDVSRTFDNLYPSNHNLYGLADMIAWKNMNHYAALLEAKPGHGWTLRAGAHEYFLLDPSDSWYGGTGTANVRPGGTFVNKTGVDGTDLGAEYDLEAVYETKHIGSFAGGAGLFEPGPYVQRVSGHANQMTFAYLQYQARF
jgi:hypothetical protein